MTKTDESAVFGRIYILRSHLVENIRYLAFYSLEFVRVGVKGNIHHVNVCRRSDSLRLGL